MSGQLAQLRVVDSEEVAILLKEDNLCMSEHPQGLEAASGIIRAGLELLDERLDAEAQRLKIKLVLRLVVEVNGPLGDFRHLRDFFNGCIVKALLAEDGASGIQKLTPAEF